MSFIDDYNNRAAQQVALTGQTHSWDEYDRQLQQQAAIKALQDKNKTTTKPKGNFLTSLIPTGGGIGGALAGGAAGAALGSVVPIVGTAAGGLIGAILGGAGGSALGKVGENAVEGESDLGKGVGQEALLGGVTSTPVGAGLKIARAGLKVGTGIGKTAASDLIQGAAAQTVGKGTAAKYGIDLLPSTGIANKLGANLEKTSNEALSSQSLLTGAQARQAKINPVQTFGNINKRTGLTNLDDMAEVGRGLTGNGENSLLDTLTRSAVNETTGVPINDLRRTAQNLIDDKGSLLTDAQRKNVLSNVKNATTSMYGGSKGTLSTLANPESTLNQANAFRDTAKTLTNTFNSTAKDKQLAKVYNGLAKEMEDSLYNAPGVNESIPTLIKSGRDDLLFRADDMAKAGNTAQANAYRKIADELSGVKDIAGLRSMKQDFVNLGKIDKATSQAQGARSLAGADLSKKAGEIARNPFNLLALPLDAATPKLAGIGAKLGRSLQGTSEKVAGQGIIPLTAREGTGRLLTANTPNAQAAVDENGLTADDYASLQSNALFNGGNNSNTLGPAGTDSGSTFNATSLDPATSNPFGVSLADVGNQLKVAIANGDSKGYATLSDLYDKINDYETKSGKGSGSLGATAQSNLAASANGLSTLDQLQGLFQQAGGGSGRLVGSVQNVLGNAGLNNNVDLYNAQAESTITQLAKALNGGGQVTDADARVVINALPKVTDNADVAAAKFAALRQRLQLSQQNIAQYGSGNTDLSSILAGYTQ